MLRARGLTRAVVAMSLLIIFSIVTTLPASASTTGTSRCLYLSAYWAPNNGVPNINFNVQHRGFSCNPHGTYHIEVWDADDGRLRRLLPDYSYVAMLRAGRTSGDSAELPPCAPTCGITSPVAASKVGAFRAILCENAGCVRSWLRVSVGVVLSMVQSAPRSAHNMVIRSFCDGRLVGLA
jgi:hypothetical protein